MTEEVEVVETEVETDTVIELSIEQLEQVAGGAIGIWF